MRGSTSRIIIDIYGGSGLQRIASIPTSLLITATYRASLDSASTFTVELPNDPDIAPFIVAGDQFVVTEMIYDALADPHQRIDFIGRFTIESTELAFSEDGSEVLRATAKSTVCYEAERAGVYGATYFAVLGEAQPIRTHICLAQAAIRAERDIRLQVPLSYVDPLSPGLIAISSSDSVMSHLSSLASSIGMHWRVPDGIDSSMIEIFDVPPEFPGYIPARSAAFVRPPQAVRTTRYSPEPADFYWSTLSKLSDRSNSYSGIFVEGGSWRSSDTNDAILSPEGATVPAPYALTQVVRPDGRASWFISSTAGGANRPRASILVEFSGISPVSANGAVPTNAAIAVAAQALADAAVRTLKFNLVPSDVYNMTIPGPILWAIRVGDRITGFFDSPRNTEQDALTLYVISVSSVWRGGTVVSTVEASTSMASARDYRRTRFGEATPRSRGIIERPTVGPPIYSFVSVVCNPSGTYVFPTPYAAPPTVGITSSPDACRPYIVSITNTQVVVNVTGNNCVGPQTIGLFIV